VVLQTIKSKTLQRITIYPASTLVIGDAVYQEWQDLDRLLVQFQALHPLRLQVTYKAGEEGLRDNMPSLLTELTRRGLVDLVEDTG